MNIFPRNPLRCALFVVCVCAAAPALAGVPRAQPVAAHAESPAQADPGAASDSDTENGVADYNAGNLRAARAEFQVAAQRGNRLAQFDYAMMLLNGEGGDADVAGGTHWLRRAADAKMAHAQYVYGRMYDDGEFVQRDPARAHPWFLKAARQGHVQAQLALANQFLDGRGTPRDNRQAFYWYQKAAMGGDMTAQYVTGSFYELGGDGVKKNLNIARAYYAAAAAQGDPAARLKFIELSAQLREAAPGAAHRAPPSSTM